MRQARFIEFLGVLCVCRGKGVRRNQDRICELLLNGPPELPRCLPASSLAATARTHAATARTQAATARTHAATACTPGAPELLVSFHLRGGVPMVSGDPRYFDGFGEANTLELGVWLDRASAGATDYVVGCIELFSKLVLGRNLSTSAALRKHLPLPLVAAAMADTVVLARHLPVATVLAELMRRLYVDSPPHEQMALVKKVRVWSQVEAVAESGTPLEELQPFASGRQCNPCAPGLQPL